MPAKEIVCFFLGFYFELWGLAPVFGRTGLRAGFQANLRNYAEKGEIAITHRKGWSPGCVLLLRVLKEVLKSLTQMAIRTVLGVMSTVGSGQSS